jgi:hypothetical protein
MGPHDQEEKLAYDCLFGCWCCHAAKGQELKKGFSQNATMFG